VAGNKARGSFEVGLPAEDGRRRRPLPGPVVTAIARCDLGLTHRGTLLISSSSSAPGLSRGRWILGALRLTVGSDQDRAFRPQLDEVPPRLEAGVVRSALRRGGWPSGRPTSAVPIDRRCVSDLPRFGSTLGRARQITRILTPRRQQQRCYTLGISARWLPSLASLECLVGAVCFDKALNRLQVVRKGCGLPLRLSAVAVVKVDPYLKRHARTIGEAMSAHL
jgi:hypothetical protein